MEPVNIVIDLVLMLLVLMIPGLSLSYLLIKTMEFKHRMVFSMFLGIMPIYVVFTLVKNGFAIFNFSTDITVLFIFIALIVLKEDARDRIVNWLFVKRSV